MEEIDSVLKSTENFFLENNKRLFIPEFQREFVWDGEIVSQLLKDFYEDTEEYTANNDELTGYLLGNVVLIKNNQNNNFHVVDGQQRTISLSLLAHVLYRALIDTATKYTGNISEQTKWLQLSANLYNIYLINNEQNKADENRIEVNNFLNYGHFYSQLIRKQTIEEIEQLKPQSKSENNILEVYDTFNTDIYELSEKQLEKFTYYFKNKVKLILTIAPSEDKAFQLFEVLNDRGKSLEPLDLIKNIFLKQLYAATKDKSERILFNDNWQEFTENLDISRKRTISSSTFLKHYILANEGINVRKDKLYSFVKELEFLKDKILNVAEDLKNVSDIYADIEEKKYNKFAKNTEGKLTEDEHSFLVNQLKLLFEILDIKQFHSLLIPFYFKDFKTKSRVLDAAIKYGAAVMFAQRQTNTIESELETILRDYNNHLDLERLLTEVNKRKNKYVDEFRTALNYATIGSRKQKAISLLKFIEIYGNKNIDALNVPKTGKNSITLEHILPQTNSGSLPKDFENENEYNRYINYLGNLTILKKADNSSVKNKPFKEKKTTYKNSQFIMTNTLVKPVENTKVGGQDFDAINYLNEWNPQYKVSRNNWNKKVIDDRGKQLTNFIVELLK